MKFAPTLRPALYAAAFLLVSPLTVFAQDTQALATTPIDTGDTAFMLIATALVLFMTPGLAFFYSGMVRRKNVLGTLMQSYVMMGVVGVLWAVIGYSIAFGPDIGGFGILGDLSFLGLTGVGGDPSATYATTVPHLIFMAFQGMFAIITPALISGAFAERIKFSAFLVFAMLWSVLVYSPLAHWVWSADGWLLERGAWDFAGGTVVHISSAVSALAGVLFLGKRRGFPQEPILPHHLPLTILGVGVLWFGWFGFNAGSAVGANGTAALAFVTTNLAAATGLLTWMFTDWMRHGKPAALGAVSGAVAGLVAITPACGFVTPMAAIAIGAIAGVVCNFAVHLRIRMRFDDSLDVVGIHGVGGTLGAILTGVFCTTEYLTHGDEVFSRAYQIWIQAEGVLATYGYAFVVSFTLFWIIDKVIGLRVDVESEIDGLDLSQHGERGYDG